VILFFDTSALVKFFHEEEGSRFVTDLILSEGSQVWISELSKVEFLSALFRRARAQEINEEQLTRAVKGFQEQIRYFNVEPLGHAILREAEDLLERFGKTKRLRTLDAIQMGTFTLIAEKDWRFVASDEILCDIVKSLGFETINPSKSESAAFQ
jgi:uncharacterized protein with PIN domain